MEHETSTSFLIDELMKDYKKAEYESNSPIMKSRRGYNLDKMNDILKVVNWLKEFEIRSWGEPSTLIDIPDDDLEEYCIKMEQEIQHRKELLEKKVNGGSPDWYFVSRKETKFLKDILYFLNKLKELRNPLASQE